MPPRFAARVCMTKVKRILSWQPQEESTRAESGRKVSRAMSLVRNIEPKKVTITKTKTTARRLAKRRTSPAARMRKAPSWRRPLSTASMENRHSRVCQSK